MKKNGEDRIQKTIESSMSQLKSMIDVNMIVGDAIKLENGYIIPVSKVTMAILSGGGEYGKVTIFNKNNDLPYSTGNGAILSVNPCGFIVNDDVTGVKLLSLKGEPVEKIIDKTTDILLNLINKDKNEKD